MKEITRRQFIRLAMLSGSAAALNNLLAACNGTRPTDPPTAIPFSSSTSPSSIQTTGSPSGQKSEQPTSTQPAAEPQAVHNSLKDLVIARGGEPDVLARKAFAALGGMEAFVKKDADVIIKPNICVAYHTYEYAATTNPWLVAALVKMAFEAGAKRVRVMDSPFGGGPEEAYAISGIAGQVTLAGGSMEVMSQLKFQKTDIPQGRAINSWQIYQDILNADLVINVPIAKHHNLAGLTLGMKNLMGTILNRQGIHMNMGQMLADLASRIRPAVTVIDAVRILMDHGPTGGSLDDVKQLDTIIVSRDIVAADTAAAGLFGKKPSDLAYINAGAAMGLGTSDLSTLKIEEINASA